MWSSIEPPTSRNNNSFTALCRSGTSFRSSQPALCAVERIVPGRSSSSSAPSRAKRQLDIAGAEFERVVEVLDLALVPDLDRAAVALRFRTDAHALRVVAAIAEGRGPAGADPLAAAPVALLLLGEALAQRLHQLFPAAERLDLLLLLLAQVALAEFPQPLLGQLGLRIGGRFDAVEAMPEHPVEPVEMALVLDQRRARQKVEFLDVEPRHPLPHRLQQRQKLAQAGRHLGRAQFEEEGDEHGYVSFLRCFAANAAL